MRKPSRAASLTSDVVTSFWKSTKALPTRVLDVPERREARALVVGHAATAPGAAREPEVGRGRPRRRARRRRGMRRAEAPRRRAGDRHARRQRAGNEAPRAARSTPAGRRDGEVRWMRRRPAAGHRDEVAADVESRPSASRISALRTLRPPCASRTRPPATSTAPAAFAASRVAGGDLGAAVDDGDDLDPRRRRDRRRSRRPRRCWRRPRRAVPAPRRSG